MSPVERLARLNTHRSVRHAHQVSYSVRMVATIAAKHERAVDRDEFLLAACMLDAFYVHIRLLSEFFLRRTSGQDFGPRDFGIGWHIPTGDGPDRLQEAWNVASSYVVHFGRPRVPESMEDLRAFEVSSAYFRRLATDALDCFETFVDSVEERAPVWKGGALLPDPIKQAAQWNARVAHEVVGTLRSAQHIAAAELALWPSSD